MVAHASGRRCAARPRIGRRRAHPRRASLSDAQRDTLRRLEREVREARDADAAAGNPDAQRAAEGAIASAAQASAALARAMRESPPNARLREREATLRERVREAQARLHALPCPDRRAALVDCERRLLAFKRTVGLDALEAEFGRRNAQRGNIAVRAGALYEARVVPLVDTVIAGRLASRAGIAREQLVVFASARFFNCDGATEMDFVLAHDRGAPSGDTAHAVTVLGIVEVKRAIDDIGIGFDHRLRDLRSFRLHGVDHRPMRRGGTDYRFTSASFDLLLGGDDEIRRDRLFFITRPAKRLAGMHSRAWQQLLGRVKLDMARGRYSDDDRYFDELRDRASRLTCGTTPAQAILCAYAQTPALRDNILYAPDSPPAEAPFA
jgi:hypothetical protein